MDNIEIIYKNGKKVGFYSGEGFEYFIDYSGNFLILTKYNYYENKNEWIRHIPLERIKEVQVRPI